MSECNISDEEKISPAIKVVEGKRDVSYSLPYFYMGLVKMNFAPGSRAYDTFLSRVFLFSHNQINEHLFQNEIFSLFVKKYDLLDAMKRPLNLGNSDKPFFHETLRSVMVVDEDYSRVLEVITNYVFNIMSFSNLIQALELVMKRNPPLIAMLEPHLPCFINFQNIEPDLRAPIYAPLPIFERFMKSSLSSVDYERLETHMKQYVYNELDIEDFLFILIPFYGHTDPRVCMKMRLYFDSNLPSGWKVDHEGKVIRVKRPTGKLNPRRIYPEFV